MSEYVVKLPDVGEGIAEAEIVEWHVTPGDTIVEDQVMVEVMTDKATVELPSPVSGVVASLGAAVGDIISVGSPLIRIETDGTTTHTDQRATVPAPPAPAPAPLPAPPSIATAPPPSHPAEPAPDRRVSTGAPSAAPAVRQRAASLGIDLTDIAGSGPEGRVVHSDLDNHLTQSRSRAAQPRTTGADGTANDTVDPVPVLGLRRNIAQRMQISKTRIPHFTYVDEVDVTEIERLRVDLNGQHDGLRSRLTILPFLIRAVVLAIADFPQMNARYDDDNGVVNRHRCVHLGIASQTPKGLMVPVIENAETLGLWDTAEEVSRLSTAARNHTITIDELSGSTITITSLGALGGIVSTPIINYPEVAIIGVNKIATRPVYVGDVVQPRQIMNLSSSFDHRVIDGADAASFIQRIRNLLETPALLFLS